MPQPLFILNSRGQSVDTLFLPGGKRIKLAVGTVDVGEDEDAAWMAVATHVEGAEFVASDGVVALGGVDRTGTDTVRALQVDPDGNLIIITKAASGNLTDRSGALTAGGTSEEVAAANTTRKYFFIENLDDTEDMWINFGTAAVADQPSILIKALGSFVMEANFVSTQAVNIIAATTGHKWTAKEA